MQSPGSIHEVNLRKLARAVGELLTAISCGIDGGSPWNFCLRVELQGRGDRCSNVRPHLTWALLRRSSKLLRFYFGSGFDHVNKYPELVGLMLL